MNKHIEEMMKVVHNAEIGYFHTMVTADIDDIIDGVASRDEIVATALYNADYRKSNDVAREIFEEIERLLDTYSASHHPVGEVYGESYFERGLEDAIAELKKKYESEGADDENCV